jgi:hypothetical protein
VPAQSARDNRNGVVPSHARERQMLRVCYVREREVLIAKLLT